MLRSSDGAYERMLTQVKQNWPYAKEMGLSEGASLDNLSFTTDLKSAVKDAILFKKTFLK